MILADCHVHTHHSGDCNASMEAVVESALSRGLTHLCFTDHEDKDYPDTYNPAGMFDLDAGAYHAEYLAFRARYEGRITLSFGVELGLQPHCAAFNASFVREHPFDFVIASEHLIHGEDPYERDYFEALAKELRCGAEDEATEEEAMQCYLTALYENLLAYDDYDVVGHLDLVNRYYPSGRMTYSHEKHAEILDEILRHLVSKDKGLDCNTRLLQKGSADMNPSAAILARFHELGGTVITFGSDAHVPEAVALCFDRAREIAVSCGFKEYCVFEQRVPQFREL